jgi:hypothetical protein
MFGAGTSVGGAREIPNDHGSRHATPDDGCSKDVSPQADLPINPQGLSGYNLQSTV